MACVYEYAFFKDHIIMFYDVGFCQHFIVYHVEWSIIGKEGHYL